MAESAIVHRQALEMRRRLFRGRDHADVAQSLACVAHVLKAEGSLADAARLHNEALAMNRRMYGADTAHPDVASSLNDVAEVLRAQVRCCTRCLP